MQRKVQVAALAGALTTIILWALHQFAGLDIPGEVGAAITTVLATALAFIVPEKVLAEEGTP